MDIVEHIGVLTSSVISKHMFISVILFFVVKGERTELHSLTQHYFKIQIKSLIPNYKV
jgi:hypothetical protein